MVAKHHIPFNEKLDLEFDEAFNLLNEFVDLNQADPMHPLRPNAINQRGVVVARLSTSQPRYHTRSESSKVCWPGESIADRGFCSSVSSIGDVYRPRSLA